MSFKGIHPSGKTIYLAAPRPLAFAVYAKRIGRWELVARIEDRPYLDELHRVNGSYVPLGRDMTPEEKAEQSAGWWRDIGNVESAIVKLEAAGRSRSS